MNLQLLGPPPPSQSLPTGSILLYLVAECVWLCAPWTVALQAPLSMGILQARILEWVAMDSSRGSSQLRDWIQVSCTAGWILYHLSHKGSPRILKWVDYPFSSGSSLPRNWTWVSCIAGGFFTSWATREAPVRGYLTRHCQQRAPAAVNPLCYFSYNCKTCPLVVQPPPPKTSASQTAWVPAWRGRGRGDRRREGSLNFNVLIIHSCYSTVPLSTPLIHSIANYNFLPR